MAQTTTTTTAAALQTQSLPVWAATKLHATHSKQLDLKQFLLDPSLGADSVISSEEETDCESDRGSYAATPARDHEARLEAYMARKGMKRSKFQQRFGSGASGNAERLSPCWLIRNRPTELRSTTDPMAIPSKTNGYQGWDEDADEDCRCGNDCGAFFQDDTTQDQDLLQGLDDMIFDLEI